MTTSPRTFRNEPQHRCYDDVATHLETAFGDRVVVHPDLPTFRLLMGSTAVDITVYAFSTEAVVHLRALVVHGAPRDLALYDTLLRQNARLVAGSFSIDADGDIAFTHTIPAAAVTQASLERDVINVLDMADHYDDFIQGQWGGQRTIDRG